MLIEEFAPGKLILIGEYAVLEGTPALVCAVDRFVKVTIKESDTKNYKIESPAINIMDCEFTITNNSYITFAPEVNAINRKRMGFFKNTFEYAWQYCKAYNPPQIPLNINIDTSAFFSKQINSKLGFGSSAAMVVALVKALFKLAGLRTKSDEEINRLFRLALTAHKRAQGNLGSGIDVAASAFGGVLEYKVGINEKCEQLKPGRIEPWNDLPFLVVFTGSSESTRKMVSGVSDLKKTNPDLYNTLISDLDKTSQKGCRAYKQKNKNDFLKAVHEYQFYLDSLGQKSGMPIISEVHHNLAQLVNLKGGVYKPSGAGSGDIGIAFAATEADLNIIREAIEKKNFACIDVKIA